jgi:ubiquinone/menaquinone biosynthesis C-methylase UbiE
MKYTGRYGLVPFHGERRDSLRKMLGTGVEDEHTPEMDSALQLPAYYQYVDTHQHPGGLWSDEIAGLVYEFGARSTTPLLGDSHDELHHRLTEAISSGQDFKHILDMGCGFGKSTGPFIKKFPDAQIDGIDLSQSCLLVAAHAARKSKQKNVHYSQRDAQSTGLEDGSYGLVTSTMLLHEMPAESVERLLREAYRLLQPGGLMAHLDFYIFPDEFTRFLHYGHSARNNEPFMPELAEMDLPGLLTEIGFKDIEITQFRENEDVDLEAGDAWRFPWTLISARKPDGA